MPEGTIVTKHSYVNHRRYSETVYYCRFCHEKSIITESTKHYILNLRPDSENRTMYDSAIECPSCGQITESKNILHVSGYGLKHFYDGMIFYDNDDKVRLFIFSKEITFFSGKLQQAHLATMVVFNIATGQSYMFEPRYKGSAKRWRHYNGPRLRNISISSYASPMTFNLDFKDKKIIELAELLQKKLSKKLGYQVKSLFDYYDELPSDSQRVYNITVLANYVRMPNMNPFEFNMFISQNRFHYKKPEHFNKCLRAAKPDSPNPIKDLILGFKGPYTKSMAKLVREDMNRLVLFDTYSAIKDINNLRKIIFWIDLNSYSLLAEDKSLKTFIKDMLKIMSETVLVNKIIKSQEYIVTDTAMMYQEIILRNPDYVVDPRQSIQEMHDIFTLDYNKLRHKNAPITYKEKDFELEGDYGGLEFRLAKDTLELVNTGTIMNICVGSYDNRALRRDCGIVIAYADEEPILCIELSSDFRHVLQVKAKRNAKPIGNLYKAASAWIEDHELIIQTYDMEKDEEEIIEQQAPELLHEAV